MTSGSLGIPPTWTPGSSEKLKVLVVDDDILCLKLVAEMLRRCMIYEGEAAQADLGGSLEAAGYCLPSADSLCLKLWRRCCGRS